MDVELKPCPFCGGYPIMWAANDCKDGFVHGKTISCPTCGISFNDEYLNAAITAWNTRHGAGDGEDLEQFRAAVISWKDDVEWLTWANCGESAVEAQARVDEANRLLGLIDAQKAARAGDRG